MVGVRSSLNIVQVPGGNATVLGRVTSANTGIYLVPAGKVTKVFSGSSVINVLGADATSALAILRGGTFTPIGEFVGLRGKTVLTPPLILQAGDRLTYIGDAGATNATMDMSITYMEFDV